MLDDRRRRVEMPSYRSAFLQAAVQRENLCKKNAAVVMSETKESPSKTSLYLVKAVLLFGALRKVLYQRIRCQNSVLERSFF